MAQASGDQAKLILYEMMYIVRVLKDGGQKLALKQESGSKVRSILKSAELGAQSRFEMREVCSFPAARPMSTTWVTLHNLATAEKSLLKSNR